MIDAEDRALLEETVRGALADAEPDSDIDALLAQLDWLDLLEAEPADAVAIVFNALGAANARSTALDDVLTSALGGKPRADLAVLLPPFASWDPPARIAAQQIEGHGLATARAATARELLVVCGTAKQPRIATVPTSSAQLTKVTGIDPQMGLHSVRVQASAVAAADLDPDTWQTALALARRATAYEIAGAGRTMLELARTHALEREQFGQPIGHFQAVRHRLAEALVAVESIEASLVSAQDAPVPETAALAKALAGRSMKIVSKHCQQVLAGIGFTTEHSFHRYLKRTMALEGLFGSADAILLDLGRQLLATRRVPTLIEL